jgi:hypothetical protein
LHLLDEVSTYADPELEEFAGKEKARLLQAIAAAREVGPRFTWTGTKASSKTVKAIGYARGERERHHP